MRDISKNHDLVQSIGGIRLSHIPGGLPEGKLTKRRCQGAAATRADRQGVIVREHLLRDRIDGNAARRHLPRERINGNAARRRLPWEKTDGDAAKRRMLWKPEILSGGLSPPYSI